MRRKASPNGTRQSIERLTRDDLAQWHRRRFTKTNLLLVVVGNVDRPRLESLVRATLAKLPPGSYRWTPPPPAKNDRRALVIEPQRLPTNYIIGYYAGPAASSGDMDEQLEAKLDAVLEKVARFGQDSLTESERQILQRASDMYKRRRT